MYRSALVALKVDGANEPVIVSALDYAVRHELFLTAVAVVDPSVVALRQSAPVMADSYRARRSETLTKEAHERAQNELAEFSERCAESGIACDTQVRGGALGEEISLAARAADFLIVGHGGEAEACSPAREDVSVLDAVLRRSPQPTLIVPCSAPFPNRVVMAFDGSVQAGRALHEFAASGLWTGCPVSVVSVGADVAEVTEMAEGAAKYLRLHGFAAEGKPVVAKQDPAPRILNVLNESGAGLLVMGAYGKPRWQEFFFGTVTRSILRDAMVPVFLSQ